MKPEVRRQLDDSDGEKVYVLLGGVPYPGRTFAMTMTNPVLSGTEMVCLLEDVGDPDHITSDATTYFSAGTMILTRWLGDRHPTDALRTMRVVHPMTGAVGDNI